MKLTWLTFVKSEESNSLEPIPFNIFMHYHLLWGISQRFLLLGRVIVSEWGFKPNTKASSFGPPQYLVYNNNKIIINNYKSQIPNQINYKCSSLLPWVHWWLHNWLRYGFLITVFFDLIWSFPLSALSLSVWLLCLIWWVL